jgi:2-iminobutanoate/2-iminopropanoate deaminase
MIASLNGHPEVVDSLIKAGADIYAKAKYGQTALKFASEQGHAEIVVLIRAAQVVNPPDAPPAMGPYSHAMVWEGLVFVSGQGPVDRTTGEVKHGDILQEMSVAVENIRIILEAADSGLENVLKATIYLADMNDLDRVNEKWKEYFGPVLPALTTIQANMPFDIKIEIDVVAHKR